MSSEGWDRVRYEDWYTEGGEALLCEAVERVLEDVNIEKNIMRLKMLMAKHDLIGFFAEQVMECRCVVGCADT